VGYSEQTEAPVIARTTVSKCMTIVFVSERLNLVECDVAYFVL
jgi:hypothetical protein